MIVWGGSSRESTGTITGGFNTGGRYNPATDSWTPTSGLAPPSDRFGYTTVWTGNSIIVWGGSYVNVGDRYDLVTDDWTRISTIQEPDGRVGHSAVWTGTHMIVWGGQTRTEAFLSRTGGRYDPISDTWTPTSTVGTPQGRVDATVVWTGEEMIVWGGDDIYHPFATGGRYRAVTDTWVPVSTSNAPTARSGHTAVWTGSRMVVWGGLGDFDWVETGGLYDPASDTWMSTSTTQAPTPRYSHTAVWTGTRMIVWGGSSCPDTTCVYFNTGASYDLLGDTWLPTSTVNAPDPRFGHTAVWTGDRMVVWGGGIGGPIAFDTGGRYDPLRDEWSPTSPVNAPRPLIFHHAVWTGSLMIVWGGSGGRYALGHDADNDGDGLSECAGHCNDADSAVYPGAPEICDGLDNDCDAVVDNAPVPGGIPLLTVQPSGSETLLSWSSLSQATGSDVVRGDLSILLGSGGDFAPATQACLADDLEGTFLSVTDAPATDDGSWYLVRPVNCGGHGSYDSGGPAQVRPRDDGINATASSCP